MNSTRYQAKPLIAIVDDDSSTLEALRIAFQDNFRPEAFANAASILAAMRKRTYAVAIVDILLPDKNGESLLAALKSAWPLTEIIIVTGALDKALAQSCYEKGAYDFFTKPWDIEALNRTVKRAAEKYELVRRLDVAETQLAHRAKGPKESLELSKTLKTRMGDKIRKIALESFSTDLNDLKLPDLAKELEKGAIEAALLRTQWNQLQAAKLLGIHRATIVNKMKEFKISSVKRPKGLRKSTPKKRVTT